MSHFIVGMSFKNQFFCNLKEWRMRTFIIRARKGTTNWKRLKANIGSKEHFEVIAHSVINAFFISNGFRTDVEVYVVLDSSEDFPRTIKLSAPEGISLAGFHEAAVITLFEKILQENISLMKDETRRLENGITIYGFGFEKLIANLLTTHTIYLLDPKGEDIRTSVIAPNPVFILSDHLALPKNILTSLKRRGVKLMSLGKKMLFASQCIVLINYELDRNV